MTATRRIHRRSIALYVAAYATYAAACGESPPTPDETATASGAGTQHGAVPGTSTGTSSSTGASATAGGTGPRSAVAGTVTLLTGDRVTVTRNGARPLVRIEPGAGRTKVAFAMQIHGDSIEVIPSDVADMVGGSLDRALFDVGAL